MLRVFTSRGLGNNSDGVGSTLINTVIVQLCKIDSPGKFKRVPAFNHFDGCVFETADTLNYE